MARILVVDDEPDLCEILCFNLENEGFDAERASSAEAALQKLEAEGHYDLILLDVMMESMSGFDMARRMRDGGDDTPIIFLTARTAENDLLDGFASGGDDYIMKPFSFPTVLARIKAVLKRTSVQSRESAIITIGDLTVETGSKKVTLEGLRLSLTKKEYSILLLLIRNQGRHFTRQQILEEVWEEDAYIGDRSVDVHITRLRKKLGNYGECIVNHTGFGYIFQMRG